MLAGRQEKGAKRGEGILYISRQFSIVQIALEDDYFALLEIAVEFWSFLREAPVTACISPEAIRSYNQSSIFVEFAPLPEEQFEAMDFLFRQRILGVSIVLGGVEESLRIGQCAHKVTEIFRDHVGDEPGYRLWMEDDSRREICGEQVSG